MHKAISISLAASSLASNCLAQSILVPALKPMPSQQDAPAYVAEVGNRVAILGNIAYVADGYAGLQLYELTAGGARHLAGYDTGNYTQNVRIRGRKAIVSDSSAGLLQLDLTDPINPRQLESKPDVTALVHSLMNEPTSASPGCVAAILGHRIYIARNDIGVVEIELHALDATPPPLNPLELIALGKTIPKINQSRPFKRQPDTATIGSAELWGDAMPAPTWEATAPQPVLALQPIPELVAHFTDGTLKLIISGWRGQSLRVQRSSDLSGEWEDWRTIVLNEDRVLLEDADAASKSPLFYRVIAAKLEQSLR